jgi:hypothetical protein
MAVLPASARPSTPNPLAGLCEFFSKKVAACVCACNQFKTIYALRDNSPQGPPVTALLKQTNLECSILMMSPIYAMSMVGVGISFIKKRFGGSALTATLASKMLKSAPAGSASLSIIVKRVFGGRGSKVIAHCVRKELSHMTYQQPVCKYMSSLQVFFLLRNLSNCNVIGITVLQAEARWRIACDRSAVLFSADTFNARILKLICTAAEGKHIDIVELCSIAEPNSVLAKDR